MGRGFADPGATARLVCVLGLPFFPLVSQVSHARNGHSFGFVPDLIMLWVALACARHLDYRRLPRVAAAGFALFCLAELVGSVHAPLRAAVYGLRNDVEAVVVLALVLATPATQLYKRAMLREFTIGIQLASVIALVTWRLPGWLVTLHLENSSGHFPTAYFVSGSNAIRAFSPALGPNELALLLASALAAIWTIYRLRGAVTMSVLPIAALVATHSRSGALATIGAAIIIGLSSSADRVRRVFLVVAAIAGGTFVAVLVPALLRSKNASTVDHIKSLRDSTRQLLTHPLGYGTGTVGPRAARFLGGKTPPRSPESEFFLYGLSAGPVSLVGYMTFLASMVVAIYRRARTDAVARAGLAQLAALIIVEAVLPITSSLELAATVAVLIGTVGALGQQDRPVATQSVAGRSDRIPAVVRTLQRARRP